MNAYAKFVKLSFFITITIIITFFIFLLFPKPTFADWCTDNNAPQGWACGGANYCSGGDYGGNVVNDWGYCDWSTDISRCYITDPAKEHTICQTPPSPNPWTQCGPQSCGTPGAPHCDSNCVGIPSTNYVSVTFSGGGCSSAACQDFTYSCSDLGDAGCGECGNPACPTLTPTPTPTPAPSYVQIAGHVRSCTTGAGITGVNMSVYDNNLGQTRTGPNPSSLASQGELGSFWIDSFVRMGDDYAVRAPSSSPSGYQDPPLTNDPGQPPSYESHRAGGSPDCRTNCDFCYNPVSTPTPTPAVAAAGTISGTVRVGSSTGPNYTGSGTVCLDPNNSVPYCSGKVSATLNSGEYVFINPPAASHNVFLDPNSLQASYSVTGTNPVLSAYNSATGVFSPDVVDFIVLTSTPTPAPICTPGEQRLIEGSCTTTACTP